MDKETNWELDILVPVSLQHSIFDMPCRNIETL
jgi:hypothetical protein